MIVFDLLCSSGHMFEAWFGSSADYEKQSQAALIACPMCDDTQVVKALMTPAIPAKGNRRTREPAESEAPAADSVAVKSDLKGFFKSLAAEQARIEAASDYVGEKFAEEARAIHYGETEARSIYGETTPIEAEALREEGVPVWALPFRTRRADA